MLRAEICRAVELGVTAAARDEFGAFAFFEQRAVTVRFAGGEARIPEIPYILALLSGAPLLIFFVYRTGKGRYHFLTKPPLYVLAASRLERRKAIETAAQAYADLLAETVRAHPYEWYHFEPFLIQ